jgi:drug/metabolite transporter (DMT)-like permease
VNGPILASRVQLLAAAALFSTGGAAIKAVSLDGWQVACFRAGIAAVVVAALVPESRRRWTAGTAAVSAAYAATVILFVQANKLTTAASTIFIQAASPLFIAGLGPWLIGERLRRRDAPILAALIAGLALFFVGAPAGHATAPHPRLGNALAAVSSVTVALMMMGLRWLGTRADGSAPAAVVLGNLMAFAVALPFSLPVSATAGDAAILAYLGVFQIGLAYTLLLRALRRVSALEASLLLFVEPVLSPLWAWLVHGELPGRWAVAGGALILAATAAKTVLDTRSEPAAKGGVG